MTGENRIDGKDKQFYKAYIINEYLYGRLTFPVKFAKTGYYSTSKVV